MRTPIKPETEQLPRTAQGMWYDLFLLVFERMEDGVILLGAEGQFLQSNPACFRLYGLKESEFSFLSDRHEELFEYYLLDGREVISEEWPISLLQKGYAFKDKEFVVVRKDNGSKFYASVTAKPELDEKGNYLAGVIFIKRIDEQVKSRKDLEKETSRRVMHEKELEGARLAMDEERRLLKAIIDTIPVMIVIYDKRVRKALLNKAVEEITGWNSDDLRNGSIMELAYPDPQYRKEVYSFMSSLQPGFKDILMHTRDGRTIKTSWANVKLEDGRQVGVGIDITDRKRLEEELLKAKEKAEKESRIQSSFIQNISHEVRTPMNSILGFTELLHGLHLGDKEKEYLDSIAVNGRQLLRLIDDIVDFSRLDKNEMSLLKKEIRIRDFMVQLKHQFPGLKEKYNRSHLEMEMDLPEEEDPGIWLNTDVGRLRQVMGNLLSNALKYTERGKITLGYELRKDNKDVLFYVRDTGIGIREEHHERVFERFYRSHHTSRTEYRGTGLGLAICKHLVLLMGGEIWFDSRPGLGTTFYFTHPYTLKTETVADEKTESLKSGSDKLPDLRGCNILVVEDDEFSFQLMKAMMEDTGAFIIHADTGKKAVDILKKRSADLVFLDIRLPEMDGYQVIREIRSMGLITPVIAQTAHALPEDIEKSYTEGFNYHVTKPVSLSELYRVLNKYLG